MENALESIHILLTTTDILSADITYLKILLERIEEILKSSDKHSLEINIAIVFGHDDEDVEEKNIISFIKTCSNARTNFVPEFLKFIENLCLLYPEILINFVEKIIDISKQCALSVSVKNTCSDVPERANLLLKTTVETFHGSGYNFSSIYDEIVRKQIELDCIKRPKVYLAVFKLVGVLSHFCPDSIQPYKCNLLQEAQNNLAVEGRKQEDKRAYLVVEGSFEAINGLLLLFRPDELQTPELSPVLSNIYNSIKWVIDADFRHRHSAHRVALSIIENHSGMISHLILKEYVYWHKVLLKWIDHKNKDDKDISLRAQKAYLRQIAKLLTSEQVEHEERKKMIEFFFTYLRDKISEENNASNVVAAIEGIGLFAPAILIILDSSKIEKLFEDLVQRIDSTFPQNDSLSSIVYLSEYVGALAAVGSILSGNLKQHQLESVERIAVKLMAACNTLTGDKLEAAVASVAACCVTAFKAGGKVGLEAFVHVIVYQGIIKACCQQPFVKQLTKMDFEETTSFKVVVEEYLPFWEKLLSIHKNEKIGDEGTVRTKETIVELVYEAVIESIVKIINNLDVNFEDSNFNDANTDPSSDVKANNDADMAIVMNLEFLFSKLLPKIEIRLHEKYISLLLRNLTTVSTHNPRLPSYYKLLATVLSIAEKLGFFEPDNNFEDSDLCQKEINYYIGDLLVNLHHYHKDVQESCLRVITSSSVELIASHLQQLPAAFKVLFHIGRSDLELSSMGVSALDRWMSRLSREDLKQFFQQVIPYLYPFLDNRIVKWALLPAELLEYAQSTSSRNRNQSKRRRLVEAARKESSLAETQLSRLQQSILALLGRLDLQSMLAALLANHHSTDLTTAWVRRPVVFWQLHFQQVHVVLHLDVFAPRAMEVALHSSDPANKDASFELLHAIFTLFLANTMNLTEQETTDDHKQFLRKMLQGMFRLGCRSCDPVGRDIFSNLLRQTSHWYARNYCYDKKFAEIFVDSLLDALTCPTDIEVREFAAECLHEYVSWTLRPSDEGANQVEKSSNKIDYILSRMSGYCDHPCPFKRQGAAMGFNRIYADLREQLTSVVDVFWLQLFCSFVKSLLLPHPSREVFAALDHVTRVMVERPQPFNVPNERRKKPPELERALLKDAVSWLLGKCNTSDERCRHKCMDLVGKLASKVQGINSVIDLIEVGNIDILKMCEVETQTSEISTMSDLLQWIDRLSASVHMFKWLKESKFDVVSAILSQNSRFLEHVNFYISKISSCSAGSIDWLCEESCPFCPPLSSIDAYDRARCRLTLNLLSFLASLQQHITTLSDFFQSDFWHWLSRCLVSPALIGFTTVSQTQLSTLRSSLSLLLTELQQNLGSETLKHNFVRLVIKNLQENEGSRLATGLTDLIKSNSISVKLNCLNSLIILKQINLLDADDQSLIRDETLWSCDKLIEAVANCLVEEDKAVKRDKSQTLYLELLLDFAFLLQYENTSKLIECMCNDDLLKYEDEDKNVTKGQHLTNTFNEKIFAHLCKFPTESVEQLLQRFPGNFVLISKYLCTLLDRSRNCEDRTKLHIAALIENTFPREPHDEMDSAIKLIYSIRNFLPGHNIRRSGLNNIFNFVSNGLKYGHSSQRPRILKTLLQVGIDSTHGSTSNEKDSVLRGLLRKFMNDFPTSSKEWGTHSHWYKEVFNILLEMIERTGSRDLVMSVTNALADDPAHPFREKFKTILGRSSYFFKGNSLLILDELYETVVSKKTLFLQKPDIPVKLVQDFMLPIIQSTSIKVAEEFFLKRIKEIVVLLKDEAKFDSWDNMKRLIPTRAASMLLIGALFSKFPSSDLTSKTNPIVLKSEEFDKNGAVLLRTCTTRVLAYLGDELNEEAKEEIRDHYELYLSYKQIAFNTLIILVSNTKRDFNALQFYGLIFKNIKFIMPRELISISNMVFDEIPKRKQALIGIRRAVRAEKRKRRSSASSMESYQLFTQSLGNSTFAEDVYKYDLSNVILREQEPVLHEDEDTDQMVVELEADNLNSHPCMPALCGTIMNLHKITTHANPTTSDDVSKTEEKPPIWITFISSALKSSSTKSNEEVNAKLFLIKLLHNCNETDVNIFSPYAKHLLPAIVNFIIENKVRCFANKMNYMIGDVLGMLTSWSSVVTPNSNEIYQLLSFMFEKTPDDRKDVMKLNIETVKTVISSWKDNISIIPHETILDFLSDTNSRSKLQSSLEFIGCLLNYNIKPYAEENLDRFYKALEKNVFSKDGVIRKNSAEILGMLYRFLSNDGDSSIETRFDLENLTKNVLLHARNKDVNTGGLSNMILFTSLMKNHYPQIVTYFVKDIVSLISTVHGSPQQHVLDIVNTALQLAKDDESLYPWELYLDVKCQLLNVFRLGDVDNQETALRVVTTLRCFLNDINVFRLLQEVVKHFSNHSSLKCRKAYYDVLINVYEYYQTKELSSTGSENLSAQELTTKELVTNALVAGLDDPNNELGSKVFEFWNKQDRLSTDLLSRLKDLFQMLYSPQMESSFLSLFLQLLLHVCQLNPAYHSCIFPDRAANHSESEILDLKLSRAKERDRLFRLSAIVDGAPIPIVGSTSLHSFAVETTVTPQKRPYSGADSGDEDDGDFKVPVYKARRLQSDKQKISQSAAYMNQQRNLSMASQLSQQKANIHSQVHLTRPYTNNDLPDRSLTNENVLVCLLKFAKKDMPIASQLLTSLLEGLIRGYQKKCSQSHNQEESKQLLAKLISTIDDAFKRIMNETKQATRGVISVLLDTCLKFATELDASKCVDKLYDVSNRSGLHSLGALVLENSLISSGNHPNEREKTTWVYVARLYRSLGFSEIVQGIFKEKLASDDVRKALEYEAAGELINASKTYSSIAVEMHLGTDDENEQRDFIYEAYFNCMARMADWNGLKKALLNVSELDEMWNDNWSKENLLPWMFKSELNEALSSKTKDIEPFMSKVKLWLGDRDKSDYIKTNIGEELCMLHLVNKSFDRASEVSDNNRKFFLEDWMHLPALSHNLMMDKCLKLQRLMDIESTLAVLKASRLKTADWFPSCIDLLQKWDLNPPLKTDSLSHWELRTKYRAHFCRAVLKKWGNSEIISNYESNFYLSLLDLALEHENVYVAKTVLGKGNKKKPMWIAGKSRAELLLARKYDDKSAIKLEKIVSSWKIIDDLSQSPEIDLQVKLVSQKHVTEICTILRSVVSKDTGVFESKLRELQSSNDWLKNKFPQTDIYDGDRLLEQLYETGLESLKAAVQIANEIVGVNSKADLAETYLTLAKYCLQQQANSSVIVESKIIESLLRAMKLGSKEAQQLFPIILSLPSLAETHSDVFIDESKQVPAWMFLLWVNQMLARVDTEIGRTLEPVLLRLATEYPSALTFPLDISISENTSRSARDIFEKLKSVALLDNETSNFVEAIKFVILPGTLLLNYVRNIEMSILCKESEENVVARWNELQELVDKLFPNSPAVADNFRGSLYISFEKNNKELESYLRESLNKRPKRVDDDSYKLFRRTSLYCKSLELEIDNRLHSFSKWFDFYQSLPQRIEIPGQLSGESMPISDKIVKISKFSKRVSVMSSIRKPVKISVIGSDGLEHGFLVKQGEDLRQDQRIMQAFRQMDTFLTLDNVNSPVMKYSLKTYNVIPFTTNLGLLSWVDGSMSLEDFLLSSLDEQEKKDYETTIKNYLNWLPSGASQTHQYQHLYCQVTREQAVSNFRKNVLSLPQDILRRSVMGLSQSAEACHYLRTQLGCSLAAMSVCHWLVGVGDRHLSNVLVCLPTNGGQLQLCGIDFGYAFGSATEVLAIPELLPFRLTPQMLNLFEPFRTTGLIKESMCRCLEILRKRKLLIMASIEVFIHEPLMDWAQQAKYFAILKGVDISDTDYEYLPRDKIERARKKLDGANPAVVMAEDLSSGHRSKPYYVYVLAMVNGDKSNLRSSKSKHGLTVREQVECLIDLATDEHILGKSYVGLKAWF
ncbi:DNA-dependent protein kinase catalytic subunit [Nilaparvata lugens]|uniref:DNA-dependent protein kinase catalytic subunit n=1 Tax=Nilaparvata lugens TaxID=108931 RepID=UPI00193CA92D|nr:DNA-dependent protein kinase catalytic subunit [Nilaparvata lugens]